MIKWELQLKITNFVKKMQFLARAVTTKME
jgi:hypothetical protein